MTHRNAALLLDGYKTSHVHQYSDKTTLIHSNYTARKSRIGGINSITFFGLQYWIKKYVENLWNETFFKRDKEEVLAEIRDELELYCPLPDYSHFEKLYDLGYLPIEIWAVEEGVEVPIGVPCFTIHNTLPEFYWVTNMLETNFSNVIWMPINSATIANQYRKNFEKFAKETCETSGFVPFQGHDFSYRGMAGTEAAEISGAAHLTSFMGTDTIPAIRMLRNYYGAKGMVGCSVPATEHSVMTSGIGLIEKELEETGKFQEYTLEFLMGGLGDIETPDIKLAAEKAYILELLKNYPKGILSLVMDSYDFWGVVAEILPSIRDQIMPREGKLVVRPDSGCPVKILTGYFDEEIFLSDGKIFCAATGVELSDVEVDGLIQTLFDTFGGTLNNKGYRELDSHIGAIYGDAITLPRQVEILSRLQRRGYASNNVVLGIG